MPRVKRGMIHLKNRRNILKAAKGFRWGRKSKIKLAKTAVTKAGAHAYVGRKLKKRDFRALWNIRLNAAARENGMTYSTLIHALKAKNSELDRKVLSSLAATKPELFAKIIEHVK